MDFFSTAWSWITGKTLGPTLVKTALLGYASRLLYKSTESASTGDKEIVDKGVRIQVEPSTDNRIPILYGEAYFGGYITDVQLAADYKKMTYCLTLAELTGTKLSTSGATSYSWQGVYINGNRVIFKTDGVTVNYTVDSTGNQDISLRDLVKVYFYCDQTGVQPTGYSGTTPSPFTTMPGWSNSTHSMEDLCYAIVEVTYNKDSGVGGLPDCKFHVTSTMTLPGDVLYDYMTNTRYGAGLDTSEINTTSLTALNTFCTTGFSYTNLASSTVSSTITVNGLVDTATDVLTNMQALAEAGSSWLTYDIHTGRWETIINKAETSVASFDDSNMIGKIDISGTSLTQLNNVADVKYQNTDILDETDFVKISIPSGELYANEPMNSVQINLPFTNKQVVAAKIGLQQLKQSRVDKIITFQADYSYILLGAGDVIDITSPVYGFTNKLFRIVTVTQSEGDNGQILLNFTCLEYDAAVYDYDIQQYEVETDDGILGIGSIGKPDTPTVTKTELANVPKIVIETQVPSGIVDSIEYWITFDVGVLNDANRTYILIGRSQNTDGTLLTENLTVSYTYSGLGQGDFYVKVRGVNNVSNGPYSDPSGLVEYRPTVVADTVSDTPVSVGGQLMGLGLLTLLNNMDKLFGGSSATGGVFDKIFEIFTEVTGVDLVGQASGGTLVVAGSGLIDGLTDVDTTTVEPELCDTLMWDGSKWVPSSAVDCDGGGPCLLDLTYFPYDRPTQKLALGQSITDKAPHQGNMWFRITGIDGAPLELYAAPTIGSGAIKLYKSDGTLVETKAAGTVTIDNDLVFIPFADRELYVDYYVLMDAGIVNYAGCPSPAITLPTTWNFHTGIPDTPVTPIARPLAALAADCKEVKLVRYITESKFPTTTTPEHTKVFPQSYITLVFNQPIILQTSGTITVKNSIGTTYQTINLAHTFSAQKVSELVWVSGSTLVVNVTKDFTKGSTYYLNMTANCVKEACGLYGNAAITDSSTVRWTVDGGPGANDFAPIREKPINNTGFIMPYDRPVKRGSGTVTIKDASGNVLKVVPATADEVSIQTGY
jgi:hypothetical protein